MTDIVERLRKFCKWPEPGDEIPNDPVFANVPDLKEAADEIERLRKDNADLLILVDMTKDAAMGHQERAAIFRRALQDIVNSTMSQFVRVSDLADYQIETARAALAKEFDNE